MIQVRWSPVRISIMPALHDSMMMVSALAMFGTTNEAVKVERRKRPHRTDVRARRERVCFMRAPQSTSRAGSQRVQLAHPGFGWLGNRDNPPHRNSTTVRKFSKLR